MAEYGRIHTDGSRSGGEAVLLPCPFCGAAAYLDYDTNTSMFGPNGEHIKGCVIGNWDMREYIDEHHAIAAWNTRQPTQSDALRDLVATLWCASGCSCCRDDDAWEKASHELAELLGIPKYNNGSGYDWYSVCDAAKGQSK